MKDPDGDELAIFDIVEKLWRRRGVIVAVVALFSICGIIAAGIATLKVRNSVVYHVSLTGVENGLYPNGSRFSPNDLLIPEVIIATAKRWDLEDRNALRRALSVRFGSVIEASVHEKFRKQLSQRNISVAQIDAITASYTEELQRAVQSGLRIELDYSSLGIEPGAGAAIVASLPEIWADIYPLRFNIFADTRLPSISVPEETLEFRSSADILLANAAVDNIRSGLDRIASDNRFDSILTPAGNSGADLIEDVKRFSTHFLNPLFSSIVTDDGPISATYLRQIELEVADRKRLLAGLDDVVGVVRTFQIDREDLRGRPAGEAGRPDALQLAEGSLTQILGLAQRATLADYLQETLNKRQDLIGEMSGLETQLAILKTPLTNTLDQSFRELSGAQFAILLDEYNGLLDAARQRLSDQADSLFTPASSPTVTGSLVTRQSMILVLLSILAGCAVGGAAALLAPARNPNEEKPRRNRPASPAVRRHGFAPSLDVAMP